MGGTGVVCPYPRLAGVVCPSPHYPAGMAAVTIQKYAPEPNPMGKTERSALKGVACPTGAVEHSVATHGVTLSWPWISLPVFLLARR